ncbi:hypothetical protein ANANG_G00280150 [Anguilla anguilla]|uniref:Ig-like domain-containing protein n=1 Tax=Anguilla anguilla TaxID=7936 RepID=A0A9D3LNA1_ANGAN|nr:hypothetical protein ANANG_G00280150 [Anguilla anguilla]
MFVSFGHSITLPCHGAPSRDVEWCFQPYERTDWVLVAELHTRGISSGNGFQGRVESFHLTEPGNYSLTLSPVVYSDLGIYKCQYYNDEIILSDVKLQIRVPSNVSIAMGMSASLPCFANINSQARAGDLDILWKRGGEKVYQLLKNTVTYGPGFENRASVSREQALYGNMSLTIRQTRFSDEDDYQCFYNSPKERGNPDSASLVVTGHPPQTLTVKAGGLLSIPLYTADPVRECDTGGCRSLTDPDPETKKTIGSVSVHVLASAGLSAGAVAGIVVGVMVLLLALAGSAFAVWKFFMKTTNPEKEDVQQNQEVWKGTNQELRSKWCHLSARSSTTQLT